LCNSHQLYAKYLCKEFHGAKLLFSSRGQMRKRRSPRISMVPERHKMESQWVIYKLWYYYDRQSLFKDQQMLRMTWDTQWLLNIEILISSCYDDLRSTSHESELKIVSCHTSAAIIQKYFCYAAKVCNIMIITWSQEDTVLHNFVKGARKTPKTPTTLVTVY
jgi:hypothetical protein